MPSTYVVRRPVANSYLVRERDRRRLRELTLVLLAVLPLVAVLIGYVWVNLELLRCGYRIHALEGRLEVAQRELQLLELEAAYQTGAARLQQRARAELGMQPAAEGQMVALGDAR